MARWWRHTLIAIAGLAAAFPLRVQLDLGHGSFPPSSTGQHSPKATMAGGTETVVETGMAAAMVTATVRVTAWQRRG